MTAVPTWLEPVGARDRAATRMTVGDHFGLPDEDDEDEPPRRRLLVAPPAAIALILVGVAACAVAGFSLLRGGGAESATPVAFPATAGPTSAAVDTTAEAPAPAEELVVSVVGLVHRPGLVRLSGAARVADAIARAGGARKGADMLSLNLAQRLNDGDQILVGYAGDGGRMAIRSAVVGAGGAASVPSNGSAGAGAPSGGANSSGTQSAKVDLNTATEAQLDELPGVGPVTARAIIAWREANGRFGSVEQLAEVDGIGPTRLSRLRDLVTV
ncbi:ComEA family DNA-binding protein [Gordonia sp. PKS22-38]|uniref:ComEA family DNA-binding protein n=1 Tax=Gordonia prachuapensis TaxID=3115651 RepID=A0ABU7MWM4_9ACTN|nr:ComEA family DNA-binding protein [Gordonia sp. PKS22-38]